MKNKKTSGPLSLNLVMRRVRPAVRMSVNTGGPNCKVLTNGCCDPQSKDTYFTTAGSRGNPNTH